MERLIEARLVQQIAAALGMAGSVAVDMIHVVPAGLSVAKRVPAALWLGVEVLRMED